MQPDDFIAKTMSIFNWFLGKKSSSAEETVSDEEAQAFSGLDIRKVAEAQILWRKELEEAIKSQRIENYSSLVIASPDHCALGKWIDNDAKRFHMLPEYKELQQAHEKFHRIAGEILAEIQQGTHETAMSRINDDLRGQSDQVHIALIRLKDRVDKPKSA